ncbi:MAG: hypothetical protein QOE52_1465 [Mycobacterium sp.]|nr:hypothetical protein [Mycobacterium sp.]MDT5342281.1 hypothetical protein [Mycobacterium sp.]
MQAASHRYVLAAAALAATSAVVAIPVTPLPSQPPVRSIETRLVDDSIANIPVNLFDDILNIPYNEVQALGIGAGSLLDTGSWWVPGATNVWGIDTGDITHVAGVLAFAVPFPALTEGLGGLNYQVDGLMAAELPSNASCDAATCAPIVPADEITGISGIDRTIGFLDSLNPQNGFGLFDNWFQVPLQDLLSGYTFTGPGVIDPSGPTTQGFGFPLPGSNPFEGGTGAGDAYPWDGLTYTLNPLQPFENFYNSLLETPSTAGIGGTGIEIPTFTDLLDNLQNGAAGLVIDFDPFTAGSPVCPAACDVPESLTVPGIVQSIENLNPSNTTLPTWLADYAAGTADGPTTSQVDEAIAMLQTGQYDLSATQLATVDADLASINPELPVLYTNAGILTDPGYLAYTEATANTTTGATTTAVLDPVYGGANSALVPQDLLTLLTNGDTNFAALSEPSAALALLYPGLIQTDPGAFAASAAGSSAPVGDAANLSALLGLSGASTIATDISALLSQLSTELSTALSADLATTLPADLATTLPADLGTTLSADLGTTLSTDLLSLF